MNNRPLSYLRIEGAEVLIESFFDPLSSDRRWWSVYGLAKKAKVLGESEGVERGWEGPHFNQRGKEHESILCMSSESVITNFTHDIKNLQVVESEGRTVMTFGHSNNP